MLIGAGYVFGRERGFYLNGGPTSGFYDAFYAGGGLMLSTWYFAPYNAFPDSARAPVTSPIVLGLRSNPMATLVQFRSLDSDPKVVFVVGPSSKESLALHMTPASYAVPGGGVKQRSPKLIEIGINASTAPRGDLVACPSTVKTQLAHLIEAGKIEIVDDPGGADVVFTGDDVRTL